MARERTVVDVVDKFWQRVDKRGEDECWNWTGPTHSRKGYGVIAGPINGKRYVKKGESMLAHRVSWILANGPIPGGDGHHGTVVRHKCDNPSCVNPRHLELGTQKDNVKDAIQRQRNDVSGIVGKPGTSHPRARLSDADLAIVADVSITGVEAARLLGVHQSVVNKIRSGATYVGAVDVSAHQAAIAARPHHLLGRRPHNAKLTDEQIQAIMASGPREGRKIARELGVSQSIVSRLKRGVTYR